MSAHDVPTVPWVFISNMYPSAEDVSYGAFVERSHEDLLISGFNICQDIVIRGRTAGRRRLRAYATHYARLLLLLVRPRLRHLYVHYVSHHCLLPALGARFLGKQVVVNVHGDDLALARASRYRRIMSVGQGMLLRSACLIVVPSPYFKELTLQRFSDIPPDRIVVSPSSGIDFSALSAATIQRSGFWDGDPADRLARIGYIGRIDGDKGWETLFDAFLALPDDQRCRAILHFWGEGAESGRLRARIGVEGEGRIFHHGAIPASELPSAHAQFDVHVVPSHRESLGLAAIEGLGAGHLLVCRAIRPFTDMTVDGDSALHFEPNGPRSLEHVLARVLRLPGTTLAAIAVKGQGIARQFDRQLVASELARQINSHLPA